jgi:glycosyltransferase involved in cell wall biosynthesis
MTIEAFASGVAVIGSDSGEIPFVLGDAGVVVEEDDAQGWVAAVEDLLCDDHRRRELTERGLRRVGRYTAEGVAPGYKRFYRWLHQQRDGS